MYSLRLGGLLLGLLDHVLTNDELAVFEVHLIVWVNEHAVIILGRNVVFSKWETFPVIRTKNSAVIRVIVEAHTEHVVALSLLEIRSWINLNNRVKVRVHAVSELHLKDELPWSIKIKVSEDVADLHVLKIVHTGDALENIEWHVIIGTKP